MKGILLLPIFLLVVSCEEPAAEVEVTSTRPLNTTDKDVRLHASDDEQFLPPSVLSQIQAEEASAADWSFLLPEGWEEIEASQFREVNVTFGPEDALGEIYVTTVGGTAQDNIGRWFRQFSVDAPALTDLDRVAFLDEEAYLVEATGDYNPGMNKPPQASQALLGVVAESQGRLVTVKMVGPEETVLLERGNFLKFVSSLKRG